MTTAQRSTAHAMIAAKGQTVTITRRASGAYNAGTGAATITTSTQTGKGVILPFGAGLRKLAGTNIPEGAVQCYLSALKTDGTALDEPKVDDSLTDANALVYAVTEVSRLSPAGLPVLYELTLRRNA